MAYKSLSWWGAMATKSWHGWGRKLRVHILNQEVNAESKLEDFKRSKTDSSNILPPARPTCTN